MFKKLQINGSLALFAPDYVRESRASPGPEPAPERELDGGEGRAGAGEGTPKGAIGEEKLSKSDIFAVAILQGIVYNVGTERKGDFMYNNIGELISRRRKQLGMNQAQLASCLNMLGFPISNQAISKWENGSTLPNARQFLALCDALGIDDIRGVFSGHGEGLLAGLNREGRRKVMDYVQLLRDTGRYSDRQEEAELRSLPLYSLAVSAGTGQFLDGEDYEMVEVGKEVPEGANFGVRVSGDSMEPKFHDGQTIWVHQQRSLMTGEIGIFLYDGSAYLKQLAVKGEALALHSLNPKYEDIVISPELPLRVLGKVISK